MTSNVSPCADEMNVYCFGSGLAAVAGGRDETRTVGETRKHE